MGLKVLRRALAAGLVSAFLAAPMPVFAQDATVVADLVVVAPASGPAWWKVSKGDASVWILGLQPATPQGLEWDQTTLKRRLKGARLMLTVYNERAQFDRDAKHPLLPPDLAKEYAVLSAQLGRPRPPSEGAGADRSSRRVAAPLPARTELSARQALNRPTARSRPRHSGPPNVVDLMALRTQYALKNKLSFHVLHEVNAIAKRAGVLIVTPPVSEFVWEPAALAPDNPRANRCLRAVVRQLGTPPERFRQAAVLWAKGDVRGLLEVAPPSNEPECGYLWNGLDERTIAFQTNLIAQALDRPGKVVAVAIVSDLVVKDGILERLRTQGFTIADPSKPLEE